MHPCLVAVYASLTEWIFTGLEFQWDPVGITCIHNSFMYQAFVYSPRWTPTSWLSSVRSHSPSCRNQSPTRSRLRMNRSQTCEDMFGYLASELSSIALKHIDTSLHEVTKDFAVTTNLFYKMCIAMILPAFCFSKMYANSKGCMKTEQVPVYDAKQRCDWIPFDSIGNRLRT